MMINSLMKNYLQWKEKSTYSKFVASSAGVAIILITCVTGFISIAKDIGSFFKSPEIHLNRLSVGGHQITLSHKNMYGSAIRYLHLENITKLHNTSQVSVRLTNKSKNIQEYRSFALALKTVQGDRWRIFVDYMILNEDINTSSLLNTPVIVKPNTSIDIEIDFLVYDGENFFKKCTSEYKISWMDSDFQGYSIGNSFETPTCNTEQKRFIYPVDTSTGPGGTVYGEMSNRKLL